MRILALYDIHGNVDALEAVLADPRAADPDLVVVGGDTVPGPFCHESLDRLQALPAPTSWVRGNGEREVAAAAAAAAADPRTAAPDPADDAAAAAHATATRLGPGRARPLGDLPLTVQHDGVLFCHATPRRDDEIITRISPAERLAEALHDVSPALVVGGHTHQQDDRTVGAVRFVNAGSVGLPYEGDGAARWLWIEDGEPDFRSTAYDSTAAGNRMLATGFPGADSINASLISPVAPAEITELFESTAAR
ncbi:MAG TPA: metallophosphoesterase family protein [Solirubrobacteraceae bacterium]|nr:metallophosphoesterase family protein [Solirubrobacteraceae bacterium]